jgi:hypothetical protein
MTVNTLRLALLFAVASCNVASCNSEIYLRDGVTDGDTFYLADSALVDPDPVLQSWASYSLTRSACQLQIGGKNPARATSFDCELTARRHLLETWIQHIADDRTASDPYLDALNRVHDAGFLAEYVAHFLGKRQWRIPPDIRFADFDVWRRENLRGHKIVTRLTGSWNYARNTNVFRNCGVAEPCS